MNIIKYATNLITAEISLVEHVKLTTFTNKTWRGGTLDAGGDEKLKINLCGLSIITITLDVLLNHMAISKFFIQ